MQVRGNCAVCHRGQPWVGTGAQGQVAWASGIRHMQICNIGAGCHTGAAPAGIPRCPHAGTVDVLLGMRYNMLGGGRGWWGQQHQGGCVGRFQCAKCHPKSIRQLAYANRLGRCWLGHLWTAGISGCTHAGFVQRVAASTPWEAVEGKGVVYQWGGGQETAEGSLQASCDALMQVRCTGCAASICLGAGCYEGVCILHRGRAGARWKVGRHAAGLFPGLRALVVRSARAGTVLVEVVREHVC